MVSGFGAATNAPSLIVRNITGGRITLVTSAEVEAEYRRAAAHPSVRRLFARRAASPGRFLLYLNELLAGARRITPTGEPPPCRDEDDRIYLHCAQFAQVDCLITRDQDMLEPRDGSRPSPS